MLAQLALHRRRLLMESGSSGDGPSPHACMHRTLSNNNVLATNRPKTIVLLCRLGVVPSNNQPRPIAAYAGPTRVPPSMPSYGKWLVRRRATTTCSRASFSPSRQPWRLVARRQSPKYGQANSAARAFRGMGGGTCTPNNFRARQRYMSAAQGMTQSRSSDARRSTLHTRRELQTSRLSHSGPTNAPTT